MPRLIFFLLVCSALCFYPSSADLQPHESPPPVPEPHADSSATRAAGRSPAEVAAIVERHRKSVLERPGVNEIGPGGGEVIYIQIHVYTDEDGNKPEVPPAFIKTLPKTIEGVPTQIHTLYVLPPPPGVIVLRPGGGRDNADVCPDHFFEHDQFGWRFCVNQHQPEGIPDIMMPPIAGIPFQEVKRFIIGTARCFESSRVSNRWASETGL